MRELVDSPKDDSAVFSKEKKKESIVNRTRSKLSLSETPLEAIEQAFKPPDITHDMYEWDDDCDDWINFLIDFTQPLEKVINGDDDPIADPDFKVLEEENIAKNNKANESKILLPNSSASSTVANVIVQNVQTQNSLCNPLQFNVVPVPINLNSTNSNSMQYKLVPNNIVPINSFPINGIHFGNFAINTIQPYTVPINAVPLNKIILNNVPSNAIQNSLPPVTTATANVLPTNKVSNNKTTTKKKNTENKNMAVTKVNEGASTEKDDENKIPQMSINQITLLHVQMTQHVQLLAQQFVMTYKHPTLDKFSNKCKENLLDLKSKCNSTNSSFNPINLSDALKLVTDWELKFEDKEFYKQYFSVLKAYSEKEKEYSSKKRKYICKIPNEIYKIFVESKCLVHPQLLPRIYPSSEYTPRQPYLQSEINLIALGLEQFMPFVKENKKSLFNSDYNKYVDALQLINTYLLPIREINGLLNCVKKLRNSKKDNPVKRYYQTGFAPKAIHCFLPIKELVPPKSQKLENLPKSWQDYITNNVQISINDSVKPVVKKLSELPQVKLEIVENSMEVENSEFIVPEILDPDNLPTEICKNMPVLNTTPEKPTEILREDTTFSAENTNTENMSLRRSDRLKKKSSDIIKTEIDIDEMNDENVYPQNYNTENTQISTCNEISNLIKSDLKKDYLPNSYKKKLKIQLSPKFKVKNKLLPKEKLKKSAKIFITNNENQSNLNIIDEDDEYDSSDEILNRSSSSESFSICTASESCSSDIEGTPKNMNNTEFPSDSDSSNSSLENLDKYKLWSKEEDKILLESIKEDYSEESFLNISIILQNRTLNEVKRRSEYLLSLIQKMQSKM